MTRALACARFTQPRPRIFLHVCMTIPHNNNILISILAGSTVITWYKGDRIVSAGSLKILNEPRFSILTSPDDGSVTLAIRKVRMGDEDDYVCEVNLKDAPISIMHHLEVLVPPRIHSVSGNGRITARKGSAISLSCIASGHPPPAIHWERQVRNTSKR